MLIEKSIMITNTGYCHVPIRRSLDAGKETPKSKDARFEKILEDAKNIVPPVCRAEKESVEQYKGKHQKEIREIIEDYKGKHLDIFG